MGPFETLLAPKVPCFLVGFRYNKKPPKSIPTLGVLVCRVFRIKRASRAWHVVFWGEKRRVFFLFFVCLRLLRGVFGKNCLVENSV